MSDFANRIAALPPDKLAALIARMKEKGTAASPQSIPVRGSDEPAPLSFAQQRLWFLDQLEPNNPFYNLPLAVRLRGVLDLAALTHSFNTILQRHEVLRTTFPILDGQPVQLVHPAQPIDVPVVDLASENSRLAGAEQEAEVARLAVAEARQPFNLAQGPLVRLKLLRLQPDQHVLLLNVHHIVTDAWSLGRVLIREFATLYQAYPRTDTTILPPLPIQYADYAVWQRSWLQGSVMDRLLDYWTGQLADAPQLLELPTDRPRRAVQSYRGASYPVKLSPALSRAIGESSRKHGVTPFVTLLTAFAVLLARYSGQYDFVLGSDTASRNRVELEGLIGFFANTLALRINLEDRPTLQQALARTHEVVLGATTHQDLPFEKLVEVLQIERNLSHNPLFQVMFSLDTTTSGDQQLTLPGLTLDLLPASTGGAIFDLNLDMEDGPDGLQGTITYSTDLFEAATIARMAAHFETILMAIVTDAAQSMLDVALLSHAERRYLLEECNTTQADFPRDLCFPQIFEAQAQATPDAGALTFRAGTREQVQLTYGELNRRANRLARQLVAQGVGPEVIVALLAERGVTLLTAILAVFKAGGAYVPLDPYHPPARLQQVLAESRAPLVLADAPRMAQASQIVADLTSSSTPALLCLEDLLAEDGDDTNLPMRAGPGNLAYVIYTSGSTGVPKGAMLEHRGMLNHLFAKVQDLQLSAGDTVGQNSSQCVDVSVWQSLVALLVGGRTHIVDDDTARDPVALLAEINGQAITVIETVPSLLHALLDAAADLDVRLPTLRWMISNGETLPPDLCRRWHAAYPQIPLLNAYGPTECSDDVTHHLIADGAGPDEIAIPIGRPIANTRLYVLDTRLQPVPIGVAGELYVGGIGVGRGYLNNPRRTADVFVPDSFSHVVGARLYRTGDLVRYRSDGSIIFLNRIDHQVKLRGFRIELGEIEAALGEHRAVRQQIVIVREDGAGTKRLVAYVVGEQKNKETREQSTKSLPSPTADEAEARRGVGQGPGVRATHEGLSTTEGLNPSDLREFLAQRLPEHMVPAIFMILPALPLSANGKIDRKALPAPDPSAFVSDTTFVAPRTTTESVVAGIWSQLLGGDRISRDANFFELGGHSLLATQVVSRIRAAFRLELPLRLLFERPTVAGLAEAIDQAARAEQGLIAPGIQPIERTGDLPLSFAQQRLWFLDQLTPGNTAYNISSVVRLRGPLDIALLERSLSATVERHEALRTTFAMIDGQAAQMIQPAAVTLPVIDLHPAAQDAEVRRRAVIEARRPFDLQRGPLLRVMLLRLTAHEHILILVMHHIIADGWSMGVLLYELTTLYHAFSQGQQSPLPPLPIQYADFAVWQRAWISGTVRERLLDYWSEKLAGIPPLLALPIDRPRPAVQTYAGASHAFFVGPEVAGGLQSLSRQANATLFMMLLAAFATLLARYSRQDDIVIGSPIANRHQAETENLIGFFVNTLALRIDMRGEPSFAWLLERVRETCLDAYAHQDLPFEQLVEALQPTRDMSHLPLFQVMFTLQNAPLPSAEIPELEITALDIATETAQVDLLLLVTETDQGLQAVLNYNTDLFAAATIRHMAQRFLTLLESICATPNRPITMLSLFSAADQPAVLAQRYDRIGEMPALSCLHNLFAVEAKRRPEAVAVQFEDQQLTYAELDRRAEQLANYLRALGVGQETLVGVYLQRSLELVIAVLGILKAGGAYVPLDPAHPAERIAFTLEDAQVRVLIAEAALADDLPELSARTICLERDADLIAAAPETPGLSESHPDNAAYVIYTSGSTGKPKGTVVTHANVTRLFAATQPWFGFDDRDVWTLFHSAAFDFSVWELWGALLYGGRLVIVPYLVSRTPDAFYALLRDTGVTVLNQTPSAFRQLMPIATRPSEGEKLALRLVIFGGEALDVPGLQPWWAHYGDQSPRLVNMYGITETTVHVTYRPLASGDSTLPASVIGGAIPDLQVYVLDAYLQPVPQGAPGELFVGGAGLARGYLNHPALTTERFLPDPFSQTPGARLYRSGDLARTRADGELEYLGRIDQQVKIRGFRIELGEIEALLAQHPAVRSSCVIVREDLPGDRQLVAYVVGKNQEPGIKNQENESDGSRFLVLGSTLRAFLQQHLPEYMLPSAFVQLEQLPLTVNGKVDRARLPRPDMTRPELESTYVAPQTPAEQTLVAIWSQVLGIEQIGIYDNFFNLGGDSIRSIQVRALAQEQGLHFSLPELFQHPTVQALARVAGASGVPAAVPLVQPFEMLSDEDRRRLPSDIEDAYPLSRLQGGMLFHSAYSPDSAFYHNVSSLHLRVHFDADVLHTVLARLVARHSMLRTSFNLTDFGEPLQLVHRTAVLPCPVDDLRHLSPVEQEAHLTQLTEHEKHHKFDLDRAPLLRFHVHRRSDDTFQFTWTEHHAILDGWSVASLLSELFTSYFTQMTGAPALPDLPPAALFRDFVAAERRALSSRAARDFWSRKLSDSTLLTVPRLDMPTASDLPAVQHQPVAIPARLTADLQQMARSLGVPLKSVLLAAHLKVMSVLGGQLDIVTGLVTNARPEVQGGEQVLGLFLNTLPLRLTLRDETWAELVQAAFAAEREILPFREYPLAEVQRIAGGQPLFETAFNFVHFHVYHSLSAFDGLEIVDGTFVEETNFTLLADFSLSVDGAEVQLSLAYDRQALGTEQIETIGRYYVQALTALAHAATSRHTAHTLLSAAEQQQLAAWNQTRADYPQSCVHDLFAAQVQRDPERIALIWEERQITYGELNMQADRVAWQIRQLGAAPGLSIAIYLERSPLLVVALLGVLKAGAAYIPLDPAYPHDRLAWMLGDSRPAVVLTETSLINRLPEFSGHVVYLDEPAPELPAVPAIEAGSTPQDLMYTIYTSGSTGTPKGVQIPHQAVVNLLWSMRAQLEFSPEDTLLAITTLSFDIAVLEIFLPLLVGARLVLADQSAANDSARILADLERWHVSVMQATPATWRLLVEGGWQGSHGLRALCGGEALAPQLAAQLTARVDRLWNVYGPTETTIWSMIAEIRHSPRQVAIGRPLANTQAYVLDDQLQPVPIGTPGALYIGGDGLAWGYLNRPALTAQSFIPHPFASSAEGAQPGARLYKTGDLARFNPDGSLQYLGRSDHQLKVRGFRIELGEIETVLMQHPDISAAAVVARPDHSGEQRLVAYIVQNKEQRTENRDSTEDCSLFSVLGSPQDLRRFLETKLPHYMMPSAFVKLDALPLTPNGKLDRRALPAPDYTPAQMVLPRTIREHQLAQLWEEILDVRPIGVQNHFFELGGHSIGAVRLLTRIEQRFGTRLSIAALLSHATVEQMARLLDDQAAPQPASTLVALQSSGARPPLFLVHPLGGTVLCYADLARRLGPDQPCYAFQSAGLEGDAAPHTSIEAMAAEYIEALQQIQPTGPYLLGGWSLGGVIAFEIAQQLRRQGQEIALLAILDAQAPAPQPSPDEPIDDTLRLMALLDPDLDVSLEDLRALTPDDQLAYLVDRARAAGKIPPDFGLAHAQALLRVYTANIAAWEAYRPQEYAGRITLFRAGEQAEDTAALPLDGGWGAFAADGVDIHTIAGTHETMVQEPYVEELARQLQASLQDIRAATNDRR
ncbi:MAG TPA: amino acid adenylation domain-containing protein [Herpetosiphonaceae bacterium]